MSTTHVIVDTEFQFLACSGALTPDIPGQIEQFINGGVENKDFATITIGGNDVGFESLMIQFVLPSTNSFGVRILTQAVVFCGHMGLLASAQRSQPYL
jgi:hypothetical protein